jgi:hypothetical protein
VLKLFPLFAAALAAYRSRKTLLFAAGLALVFVVYAISISGTIALIRANTPQAPILSYGYGTTALATEAAALAAQLNQPQIYDTAWPFALALLLGFGFFAAGAARARQLAVPLVTQGTPAAAFLFGAGIYCGTFLLGANFAYRLVFLLLCLPQLFDWREAGQAMRGLSSVVLVLIAYVLWTTANGTVLLLSHVASWALFAALSYAVGAIFLAPHSQTAKAAAIP